jgi:hypothetical protein
MAALIMASDKVFMTFPPGIFFASVFCYNLNKVRAKEVFSSP